MPIVDVAPWVGLAGLALATYGAIRTEILRRSAKTDERWKLVESLEQRMTIAELRLQPLFSVMDKRLAAMFHEPEADYWRSDYLIERYQHDPDEYRRSMSDAEIDELIMYFWEWFEQTDKGGSAPDPEKHFRAMHYLALLDGLKAARAYLRELEAAQAAGLERLPPPPSERDIFWSWITTLRQKLVAWCKWWFR